MPAFRYEAVDPAATRKKAWSMPTAPARRAADLRTQGLMPLVGRAIAAQVDEARRAQKAAVASASGCRTVNWRCSRASWQACWKRACRWSRHSPR